MEGRFEQIANETVEKRQGAEERTAKKTTKNNKMKLKKYMMPKEVKTTEPSQIKKKQERTIALVATLTAYKMAKTIGEEKKEELNQIEKKEEPTVQEIERGCEKNGRKALSLVKAFHFKTQHVPHTTMQQRSQRFRTQLPQPSIQHNRSHQQFPPNQQTICSRSHPRFLGHVLTPLF
ncbi:hypothetical protein BLNAU_6901 [Blattamonas nauphoetae]|uniref:Uncharacterized protein n=1 Tax=Blattamonas nauphoetae TaxID=2049346 RepID=A0ABQ9Y384_9EUKA|nr:hypothetical protein BLNAU_6901 [Blattamonas nauphoetae]